MNQYYGLSTEPTPVSDKLPRHHGGRRSPGLSSRVDSTPSSLHSSPLISPPAFLLVSTPVLPGLPLLPVSYNWSLAKDLSESSRCVAAIAFMSVSRRWSRLAAVTFTAFNCYREYPSQCHFILSSSTFYLYTLPSNSGWTSWPPQGPHIEWHNNPWKEAIQHIFFWCWWFLWPFLL